LENLGINIWSRRGLPEPLMSGALNPPPEAPRINLVRLTYGINEEYTAEVITAQRDAFVHEILASEVQPYTQDEANRIANMFFSDLFSTPAVAHITAIIKEYKATNDIGVSTAAGHKAE
jgi:predicted subunit of tRNA(5-methylaminomethyl-2-thiouridylate) methyltransferase